MKILIKKVTYLVIGTLLADVVANAIENKREGRTIFGNKKINKKTKVDWRGYVVLGSNDYEIRDCA